MSVVKLTALFDADHAGWSETYYFARSGNTSLQTMANNFQANRVKVLGQSAKLSFVRVNDTAAPKAVEIYQYEQDGLAVEGNGKTAVSKFADSAYAAVLMPYKTSDGVRRFVTLTGFPDDWMERDNATTRMHISTTGVTKLNSFYDYLLSAPWPLQIKARIGPPANPQVSITAIAQFADGRYVITPKAALGVAVGDRIALLKVKGNNVSALKGVRKVMQVNADNSFTVDRGPRADLGAILYLGGGLVTKYVTDFFTAVGTKENYKISSRKRGRPFAQRRGRRSASR